MIQLWNFSWYGPGGFQRPTFSSAGLRGSGPLVTAFVFGEVQNEDRLHFGHRTWIQK